METQFDVTTGTATVTLKDGVARKLKFDFLAFKRAEFAANGAAFMSLIRRPDRAEALIALLYGGLMKDAESRKESWTPEIVAELIDPAQYAALLDIVTRAAAFAMLGPAEYASGEKLASGEKVSPGAGA